MRHCWQVGVIGLGVMGQRMLARLHETATPTIKPSHIWDADSARVAATLARYPGLQAADSAEALIHQPGLHGLYIATPPASHIPLTECALDAGLAVLCEKPLSVDGPAAQSCVDRIERNQARAAVNFPMASSPGLALAAQLFGREGPTSLGPLQSVDIELAFAQWPRPWQQAAGRWLAERAEGGFSREVLSHFVFALQRVLGPAGRVRSTVRYPQDPQWAEVALSAELQCTPSSSSQGNTVTVHIQGQVGGAVPAEQLDMNRMRWQARDGCLILSDWFRHIRFEDGRGQPLPDTQAIPSPAVADLPTQWAALMEGRPHQLASYAEALAVQQTVESLLKT